MSTKHRFHRGDQVVIVEPSYPLVITYPELLGSIGHVATIEGGSIGVDFHDGFLATEEARQLGLHNLMGRIPRNTGWYVAEDELDFLEDPNDTVELLSGDDMENFLCM